MKFICCSHLSKMWPACLDHSSGGGKLTALQGLVTRIVRIHSRYLLVQQAKPPSRLPNTIILSNTSKLLDYQGGLHHAAANGRHQASSCLQHGTTC